MVSVLMYGCKQDEIQILRDVIKDIVAMRLDERLEIIKIESITDEVLNSVGTAEIGFVDIIEKNGLKIAKDFRMKFPSMDIVIISDSTVSPIHYLTPDIRAASLLLRPFAYSEIKNNLEQLFSTMQLRELSDDKVIVFREENEYHRVPYSQILYFEARNKRVYIRLSGREYGMHGGMDVLEKELPDCFRRCHRGFIVNVGYIREVWYSKNCIVLKNDVEIPLSRSYKTSIKEAMRNGKDY